MSLPIVLLLVAGLLAVVSLVQRLASRLTLPASILFAILGIVIGGAATVVTRSGMTGFVGVVAYDFQHLPVTSDTFLYVLLPALLFQSALTVDVRHILEDAAPIFLLAVVAVLIATAVIGFSIAPFTTVPLVACLMLASIVATTDTVAVISIFRDVGAPARLCRLVEGESLLNDAAAIVTFTVLLDILVSGHGAGFGAASLAFLWKFLGGMAIGYLGARLVIAIIPWLQDLRLAQVTLTLALPYLVFILGEQLFEVSGVIAAVTSGLTMSAIGTSRIAPNDWRFLNELWEQLAYWASSLIFVLAALLVPSLLVDVSWHDLLALGVMILAAFAARAVVLFGFFPLLSSFGLAHEIGARFNLVILWGGLRGAVTLALALAVKEHQGLSPDVQRFVAVLATGFVLFTLLIPGLTLRQFIRWLGLDRLSAFDQALRAQVLTLSRGRVADVVRRTGKRYRFGDTLVADVADSIGRGDSGTPPAGPAMPPLAAPPDGTANDDEQIRFGLIALTQREREIVLDHFDARTISRETVEELLGDAGFLLDGARTGGQPAYLAAAAGTVGFSRSFRFAHLLHRRFHLDAPLVDRLADRFERLLVSRIVLDELGPYLDDTIAPLVGPAVTPILRDLLQQRDAMATAALEAMRAQYSDYAALLEQRFLRRVAVRRQDVEYRSLFDEHVIGPELFGVLERDVKSTRTIVDVRPHLDLGLETRALIARVSLFADLDRQHLDTLSRRLRPQFAVPDERLISTGDPGDSMYFISSGVVEVDAGGHRFLLTRGDFFGEMALVLHQPRQADVTARSYCQLLVLRREDFQSLLKSSNAIQKQIDQAVADRTRMNERPEIGSPKV